MQMSVKQKQKVSTAKVNAKLGKIQKRNELLYETKVWEDLISKKPRKNEQEILPEKSSFDFLRLQRHTMGTLFFSNNL